MITTDSTRAVDILKNLENSKRTLAPELEKASTAVKKRLGDLEVLNDKIADANFYAEIKTLLSQVLQRIDSMATDYCNLNDQLTDIFRDLARIETDTESRRQDGNYFAALSKGTTRDIEKLNEEIRALNDAKREDFGRLKSRIEVTIPRVYDLEPVSAASQDVEKVNEAFRKALENWSDFEKLANANVKKRADEIQQTQQKFTDDCNQVSFEEMLVVNIFRKALKVS